MRRLVRPGRADILTGRGLPSRSRIHDLGAHMALSGETLICVDFDDTLVANQSHFDQAVRRLGTLCRDRLGIPEEATRSAFEAVDARYHHLGRHRNRFLVTVFAAYCAVAGSEDVPLDAVGPLAAISAYPYDAPPATEPGAEAALARLRAAHPGPLWLVTTGDPVIQTGRVHRSGMGGYFDALHVLPEKTAEAFARLGHGHINRWMVGNSPATDILPALEAGYRVAYVRTPTWALDLRPLPPGVPEYATFAAWVDDILTAPPP